MRPPRGGGSAGIGWRANCNGYGARVSRHHLRLRKSSAAQSAAPASGRGKTAGSPAWSRPTRAGAGGAGICGCAPAGGRSSCGPRSPERPLLRYGSPRRNRATAAPKYGEYRRSGWAA